MSKYGYAVEKLSTALDYAIGSNESPQRRLAAAYSSGVYLLQHEAVPNAEIHQKLQRLNSALTNQHDEEEGSHSASAAAMSDEEAGKWLREMLSILVRVSELDAVQRNAALAKKSV